MKILVVGREGQVARSLAERGAAYPALTVECVGRPDIDLLNAGKLADAVASAAPDLVINAAAYTAVDLAETDEATAFAINAEGARTVAAAAAASGCPIIQLSTDYVFDGTSFEPYSEGDPTAPINAYGRSKLAGEEEVRAANSRHLILRTSWVVSPFGRNFVRTMVEVARSRDVVRVVDDQRGAPTSALDLADALLRIAPGLRGGGDRWGTYHLTGAGGGSWADVAQAVMDRLAAIGEPYARVERIATADWPTPAKRPANSRLDCTRFRDTFGIALPDWRASLDPIVDRLARS